MPFNLRPRPTRTPDFFIHAPQRIEKPKPKKKPGSSTRKPTMSTATISRSTASSRGPPRKLDLDHSYVGEVELPPKSPKPPRHKRWKHFGEPLEDTTQLPTDWTESEPDLSDEDWDAQVERCKERIEDNILVSRFKAKLETLEEEKAYKEELIASEPTGLSWPVILRLQGLIGIEKTLEKNDKYHKLDIVRAIMKAYRSGELEWTPGLVTYWSAKGQLCQPRPLDWAEFEQVKKLHPNENSFWVEGLHGPRPLPLYHHLSVKPDEYLMYWIKFDIRLPGSTTTSSLRLIDDSGASIMTIYEDDVRTLMVPKPKTIPPELIVGYLPMTSSNGRMELPVIKIEAAVFWHGKAVAPYTEIQCALFEGKKTAWNSSRLSGPLLRHRIFTATAPDSRKHLYLGNDRDELVDVLPDPDMTLATGPPDLQLLTEPSTPSP